MRRLAALLAIGGLLYGPVAQAHVTARRPTPALARMNVERNIRANPTRIKMELAFRNFRAQELARPHVIPVQALTPPLARHPRRENLDAIPPSLWGPNMFCNVVPVFGLYLSVIGYVLGGAGIAENSMLNVGMAKTFFWTGIGLGGAAFAAC